MPEAARTRVRIQACRIEWTEQNQTFREYRKGTRQGQLLVNDRY